MFCFSYIFYYFSYILSHAYITHIKGNKSESACKNLEMKNIITNEALLRWPDGLSFGPDGLYVTSSCLHLKFSGKNITENQPYHILKIPYDLMKTVIDGENEKVVLYTEKNVDVSGESEENGEHNYNNENDKSDVTSDNEAKLFNQRMINMSGQ